MTTGCLVGYRSHAAAIFFWASAENSSDIGMLPWRAAGKIGARDSGVNRPADHSAPRVAQGLVIDRPDARGHPRRATQPGSDAARALRGALCRARQRGSARQVVADAVLARGVLRLGPGRDR